MVNRREGFCQHRALLKTGDVFERLAAPLLGVLGIARHLLNTGAGRCIPRANWISSCSADPREIDPNSRSPAFIKKYSSIELLEARIAPATFTVNSTGNAGPGTLRDAITNANAAAGADIISIESGLQMVLSSALPAITGTVEIEGNNSRIDGTGVTGDGLVFTGAAHFGSSIARIGVTNFLGNGLVFANGGGNTAHLVIVEGASLNGISITSPNNTIDLCFVGGAAGMASSSRPPQRVATS